MAAECEAGSFVSSLDSRYEGYQLKLGQGRDLAQQGDGSFV